MFRTSLLIGLASALAAITPARAEGAAGTRIEISVPAGTTAPDAKALVKAVMPADGQGGQRQVRVSVENQNGAQTIRLDLWGPVVADAAATLRQQFPALQGANINVSALNEQSKATSMAVAVEGDPSDPETLAALKKRLEEQLAAEGKQGTVDVSVEEGPDGKKKVEVRVKATKQQ
jgi:hypothetical protein